jgi:predicted DsbA family dithiol-disulfide isomerase
LFNRFAKSLGLDLEHFEIDLGSEQVRARVAADQERADALGVNRTPVVFINDTRLPDSELNQKALEESIEAAVERKGR